jgi:putative peptide zinc metalloprotease protein
MRPRPQTLAALLVFVLAFAGVAPGALAGSEPASNSSSASNRTEGTSVFDLAFAVEDVTGDAVDQRNGALAFSSCETCQTVAVAIQIVLVSSKHTSAITPVNESVSLNQDCVTCSTLAAAYQFVYGNGGPVKLTAEGRAKLRQVRMTLEELGRRFEAGELTTAEVKAELAQVRSGIRRVLTTELVPATRRKAVGRGVERGDDDASIGPSGSDPSSVPGSIPGEGVIPDNPGGGAQPEGPRGGNPDGATTTTPAPGAGPETPTTPSQTPPE